MKPEMVLECRACGHQPGKDKPVPNPCPRCHLDPGKPVSEDDLAQVAADAVEACAGTWDDGHTREPARDALWRLQVLLERRGVRIQWRTRQHYRLTLMQELNAAGLYAGQDGTFHVLLETDSDSFHPSGPTLEALVDHWVESQPGWNRRAVVKDPQVTYRRHPRKEPPLG